METTTEGNGNTAEKPAKKPRATRKDAGRARKNVVDLVAEPTVIEALLKTATAAQKLALVKKCKGIIEAIKMSEELDPDRDALANALK